VSELHVGLASQAGELAIPAEAMTLNNDDRRAGNPSQVHYTHEHTSVPVLQPLFAPYKPFRDGIENARLSHVLKAIDHPMPVCSNSPVQQNRNFRSFRTALRFTVHRTTHFQEDRLSCISAH
jgi:hypothetical protein